MEVLTEEEWTKTPITLHGKVQRYQVNVEGRLDEDEEAVDILSKQLTEPVQPEKEKPKSRWKFWK